MNITLCGAAGEVTGSGYLVTTSRATVLVDFGMFQGRGADDTMNADLGPVDPKRVDAVVLTHAHLDHSGRLPLLTKGGLRGSVFGTPATLDFTELILFDSARINEGDTRRENRVRERAGEPPLSPLYTAADVEHVRDAFEPVRYDTPTEVAEGITVRLTDAGHILGSASVEMTVRDGDAEKTIVFSGDIGPRGVPFLRDPILPGEADLVFLESTYGDRDHRPLADTVAEFQDILKTKAWGGSKVLVPAFAIGRTQQILYHIADLVRREHVPSFPIYLDSPMAIAATKMYAKHQHLFDEDATDLVEREQFQEDLKTLEFVESAAESRTLNDRWDECVIIAGSGMCDGGRMIHHLKHNLWRKNVAILAVGYMARGSLGRKLVDGADEVRIFGQRIAVRAKIHTLGGFSAHAGQSELAAWVETPARGGARIVLTHGEDRPREALAGVLEDRYGVTAECPMKGAVIEL